MREVFGCGFDGHAGRGTDPRFPEVATCPEYLVRTAYVGSVYEFLAPYRNGGLGNVLDLPAALADGLAIVDGELKAHEAEIQRQLYAD